MYSILLLAFVFFIFSVTDLINGNGYLAVYIAGLVVGNHKIVYKKSMATFFDGFTWLFQIVMFLALAFWLNPHELIGVRRNRVAGRYFHDMVPASICFPVPVAIQGTHVQRQAVRIMGGA